MSPAAPPEEIVIALQSMGIPGVASATCERLSGGVSSDIWRINLPTGSICVKRALPKLKVAADWHAPVERNMFEARWMQRANTAVPGSAPRLIGQNSESGALAMAFLPPETNPVWKTLLLDGHADSGFASQVARTLVSIHAKTADDAAVAAEFATDPIFYDIRLEPYLVATGQAHPDLQDRFQTLLTTTQSNKRALVHGDVSPKNILVGPDGPVFLDAECAWWGDPAFDLAFCLNHLLLKCLWRPDVTSDYLSCFKAMTSAYGTRVRWEDPAVLEQRTAHLLPALFLARVDGKSPVEYITREADKARVRRVARDLLAAPQDRLDAVCDAWSKELMG
jgi:aminoglycoside phosphotransferase (APT) family kinase protein